MAALSPPEDEDDEFEPLFDYSKLQPPIEEESDYEDVEEIMFQNLPKKTPSSQWNDEKNRKRARSTADIVISDNEDKDEWLAPPPQLWKKGRISEDESSIVSQLRLKKEELISLTAISSEDVIRKLEETAKANTKISKSDNAENAILNKSEPSTTKQKIMISVQDEKGKKQFRLHTDDKFEKLFKAYSDQENLKNGSLVFCFDGVKISPNQTPEDLDLVDEDIIEAYLKNV